MPLIADLLRQIFELLGVGQLFIDAQLFKAGEQLEVVIEYRFSVTC
jgi:hypothetical protein